MNFSLKKIRNDVDEIMSPANSGMNELNSRIAQFYVFCGEKYLGWDCFDKKRVTIGKGPVADLVLSDDKISDIQATFTIIGNRIIVSDEGAKGALLVNDQIISNCPISPLDSVKIGKYTIKIKLKKINSEDNSIRPVISEAPKKTTTFSAVSSTEDTSEDTIVIVPDIDPTMEKTFEVATKPQQKTIKPKPSMEKTLLLKRKVEQPIKVVEEEALPVITSQLASELASVLDETEENASFFDSVDDLIDNEVVTDPEPQQKTIKTEKPKPSLEKTLVLKRKNKQPIKVVEEETTPIATPQLTTDNKPEENSFPASFFSSVYDLEDSEEEEEDFPANFSLRDKLTGNDRNARRPLTSNKLFEIIKLRGDNVISVKHLSDNENYCLINQGNSFCSVERNDNDTARLFFTEPLLNKINVTKNKRLETKRTKSLKSLTKRQNTYNAYLSQKSETTLSDGYYDYILRSTYVSDKIDIKPINDTPLKQRILQSTAFRNTTKAIIVHLVVLVVLSFTIQMPDIEEFKDPETHFVVVDTKNIHRPVKPKPKPKPRPIIKKKPTKKIADKKITKRGTKVASLRKKRIKKPGKPKAGGGHKGNLINRNVNKVGLLGALGIKKGITVKPNAALAAVTNIDAVTSTHSREAKIKIGGIVGSLGDGNIAIPTGGVVNSKGSTNVLRSAGIGGDGSVAALEAGNTGQRDVVGTVSAPLARKIRSKGGGISREAVAKVINEHLDEISYCYESSLLANPSLMGKVVFEWKILPSGKVGEVKIKSSTLRSNEVHRCIKSAIRTWRFPKPKGGACVISYPFVFDVSGF